MAGRAFGEAPSFGQHDQPVAVLGGQGQVVVRQQQKAAQRDQVHRIIYDELCHGEIEQASRQVMLSIMQELKTGGAEAVILGCTEIALLVAQADTEIPLYDTTAIHARRAVELALG
ncbi:MAG: hypothetical protein CME82_02390 [Halomonas sp.]|nr:hypothetical protein [Halomonas sp.]